MYRLSFLFVCFWIICLFSTNSVNSPNIRQWEAHWPTSHSHLITSQRMLQRCAEFVYAFCVFVNVLVFLCGFISLHVRPSICSLSSVPKEFVPNLPSGTVPYGPQGKYICQTCTNPLFHRRVCVCVCFPGTLCLLVQDVLECYYETFSVCKEEMQIRRREDGWVEVCRITVKMKITGTAV